MAQLPSRAHAVATAHVDSSRLASETVALGAPSLVPAPVMAVHGEVCSRCGGSGRLRISDDSFRTCLDCLGQGVLSRFAPSHERTEWMQPRAIGRR